jgi:hypothetical protein
MAKTQNEEHIGAMNTKHQDAHRIAEQGTEIYQRKYRADYELRHKGRFVAIDLKSSNAYLADFPEEAIALARSSAPDGEFFLLRVGSSSAFKSSRLAHANVHRDV